MSIRSKLLPSTRNQGISNNRRVAPHWQRRRQGERRVGLPGQDVSVIKYVRGLSRFFMGLSPDYNAGVWRICWQKQNRRGLPASNFIFFVSTKKTEAKENDPKPCPATQGPLRRKDEHRQGENSLRSDSSPCWSMLIHSTPAAAHGFRLKSKLQNKVC